MPSTYVDSKWCGKITFSLQFATDYLYVVSYVLNSMRKVSVTVLDNKKYVFSILTCM